VTIVAVLVELSLKSANPFFQQLHGSSERLEDLRCFLRMTATQFDKLFSNAIVDLHAYKM
jgi:hypothetical protein